MKAQTLTAHFLVFALFCMETLAQAQGQRRAEEPSISPYRNQMMSNQYIQKYLTPSCFVGIMIALTFFGMCLAGIYMLMAIQAPTFFHQQKVNWGKVDFDS